jgi:hypothetical protein
LLSRRIPTGRIAKSRLAADLAFLRSKLAEVREMQRKGDISESDYEKIKAHLIQSMYPPATE